MTATLDGPTQARVKAGRNESRVVALLFDYAVLLLLGLLGAGAGLALGRIVGADVPATGITFAVVTVIAAHLYNRVYLVVADGQSLGQREAGLIVADSTSHTSIGMARAAIRELCSLPIRAIALLLVVVPVRIGAGLVDAALNGIPMVMCVVGVSLLIVWGVWQLANSGTGARVVGQLSLQDRLSRSATFDRADLEPFGSRGTSAINAQIVSVAQRSWIPATLFVMYWLGSLGWEWPNRDRTWLPPGYEVWQSLTQFWWFERFGSDIVPTLWTIALGVGFTLVFGISLGAIVGSSRAARTVVRPLLDFVRSIPKILLITPIVALAGSGATTSVVVIMSGALWPLLLGTIDGVAGVGSSIDDLARTYRISRRDRYMKMVLPAAAPNIFAGLRTSVSIGVILLVVVQSVGEARGIGFHLRAENEAFKFDNMVASAVMLGGLGYLLNLILNFFEKRILHWFYAKGTDV